MLAGYSNNYKSSGVTGKLLLCTQGAVALLCTSIVAAPSHPSSAAPTSAFTTALIFIAQTIPMPVACTH